MYIFTPNKSDVSFILQTFVNDVPLDSTFIETVYGIIIVIPQVLQVRRNRCSRPVSQQVNVRMEQWLYELIIQECMSECMGG